MRKPTLPAEEQELRAAILEYLVAADMTEVNSDAHGIPPLEYGRELSARREKLNALRGLSREDWEARFMDYARRMREREETGSQCVRMQRRLPVNRAALNLKARGELSAALMFREEACASNQGQAVRL